MANESVTISACVINSVPSLFHLIKAALQDSRKQPAGFHEHYRKQFSLVVGLSLTVMLVRGGQKQSCEKYLGAFLSCSDDFTRCTDQFDQIALLVAEMICIAISAFRFLGSQRYFDDFIQGVISVIEPLRKKSMKRKEKIDELLKELFETCK
jgi:hypothetical protein